MPWFSRKKQAAAPASPQAQPVSQTTLETPLPSPRAPVTPIMPRQGSRMPERGQASNPPVNRQVTNRGQVASPRQLPPIGAAPQVQVRAHSGADGSTPESPQDSGVPATPDTVMTPKEIKKLGKIQNGRMMALVKKAGVMTGSPRPNVSDPPASKGDAADAGFEAGGTILDIAGNIIGTVGDIVEAVSGAEIPILSNALGLLSAGWTLAHSIFKIIKDWHEAKGKTERVEMAKDIGMALVQGGEAAFGLVSDFMNIFGAGIKEIPIIGTIIGCLVGAVDFAHGAYVTIRQSVYAVKMSKQRKALAAGGADSTSIEVGTEKNVRDAATGKMRKKRTDEDLAEQEAPILAKIARYEAVINSPGVGKVAKSKAEVELGLAKEELAGLQSAKERDMVNEIGAANKHRARRGSLELMQGAAGIVSSLAKIDPSGVGMGVGIGLDVVSAAAGYGVKGGNFLRQKAKNRGIFGQNLNKSEENKKIRRHRLATTMFQNIRDLYSLNLHTTSPSAVSDPVAHQKTTVNMERFKTVESRVDAMDVGYAQLLAAGNGTADDLTDALRKGFYRESR